MGTEFGLADVSDVTHACVRSGEHDCSGEWLFPCALQVPGTQHLLDTILKDGLECVSWWESWEPQAKCVSQFVHPRARREWLQSRLKGASAELAKILAVGCDRFAVWRWKTLSRVTRDLWRMKDALQHATKGMRACDLGSRDSVMAQSFLTAVQSDVFWRQCDTLQALARPVSDFSSWLRACPCHEAACLAERDITCAWKGCRAPELAARVSAFSAEMLALREKHASHEDTDIEGALTRMLAVTQLKFAWVDDLPCFIWQVCSPASAAAFLAKFDTSAGPQHRVTLRFAAGEFRPDMEAWAQGADVSSRLRLEVQSYHWCKLDDTWAEAAHRDVSRISKRATFASQAWQSASLRTQQNLDLWDSLDAEGRARFDSMFYRWKAIGQLAPRLALSLIRRKQLFTLSIARDRTRWWIGPSTCARLSILLRILKFCQSYPLLQS